MSKYYSFCCMFLMMLGMTNMTFAQDRFIEHSVAESVTAAWVTEPVDLDEDADEHQLPMEFAIESCYPNPFNPTTTVPFRLPDAGEVRISVFNVVGQMLYDHQQQYEAGSHSFVFDGTNTGAELVSGMYFLKVQFNGQVRTQKIMLLK